MQHANVEGPMTMRGLKHASQAYKMSAERRMRSIALTVLTAVCRLPQHTPTTHCQGMHMHTMQGKGVGTACDEPEPAVGLDKLEHHQRDNRTGSLVQPVEIVGEPENSSTQRVPCDLPTLGFRPKVLLAGERFFLFWLGGSCTFPNFPATFLQPTVRAVQDRV